MRNWLLITFYHQHMGRWVCGQSGGPALGCRPSHVAENKKMYLHRMRLRGIGTVLGRKTINSGFDTYCTGAWVVFFKARRSSRKWEMKGRTTAAVNMGSTKERQHGK